MVQNGPYPIASVNKRSLIETFNSYSLNSYFYALGQQMVWKISFIRPLMREKLRCFCLAVLDHLFHLDGSDIPNFIASEAEDSGF